MKHVYVLTRINDGDVVVDGVYTTEKKAEASKNRLAEEFGLDPEDEDSWEFNWEIHRETLE